MLAERLDALREQDSQVTELDAWLDAASLTMNYVSEAPATWQAQKSPGWVVPIPVGYGALSPRYTPGTVTNARDAATDFRFVESLYSLGQWISPHRLRGPRDLLWYPTSDPENGLYRLRNDYQPSLNG